MPVSDPRRVAILAEGLFTPQTAKTAIGVLLIIGAFVGIAAFFGAFMNFNFMLAGSASTNPVLFTLAIALMLAWKIAGYYGGACRSLAGSSRRSPAAPRSC